MKTIIYTFILFFAGFIASAQKKPVNLYDSARVYYEKKDFKKAYYFYDTFYSDTTHGRSNYDTYYTAIAACITGETKKAAYYLKQSASIGYDLSSYATFADDPLNSCLRQLPEWNAFIIPFKTKADSAAKALKTITDGLNDTTIRINQTLLSNTSYWKNVAAKSNANQLLNKLQHFNRYPSPKSTGYWTLYHFKVNDTLQVPYLVYIPKNYKAGKKTPLFVFMHGGVSGPKNFGNPAYEPESEKVFFKRAFEQDAFIVFPFGRKTFNWLYHQEAFEAINGEIAAVKSLYNIDDDRVYIGGHSDGGRGAVWFAMNQATPFAAFYGICYFPSVYTGNTFLRNLNNGAPFYGISATDDQLFPAAMVKGVTDFGKSNGGNWKTFTVKGNHGLPYRKPDSVYFLFDSLLTQHRNAAPKQILWETDNIKNGRYYWAEINELDTVATPALWHVPLNPTITNKEGKTGKANFSKNKAAAIKGVVNNNTISLTTSCVKTLTVYFTSKLVNLNKPVKLLINGQQKFSGKIIPDKNLILNSFILTKDKEMITVAKLTYQVSQ